MKSACLIHVSNWTGRVRGFLGALKIAEFSGLSRPEPSLAAPPLRGSWLRLPIRELYQLPLLFGALLARRHHDPSPTPSDQANGKQTTKHDLHPQRRTPRLRPRPPAKRRLRRLHALPTHGQRRVHGSGGIHLLLRPATTASSREGDYDEWVQVWRCCPHVGFGCAECGFGWSRGVEAVSVRTEGKIHSGI